MTRTSRAGCERTRAGQGPRREILAVTVRMNALRVFSARQGELDMPLKKSAPVHCHCEKAVEFQRSPAAQSVLAAVVAGGE